MVLHYLERACVLNIAFYLTWEEVLCFGTVSVTKNGLRCAPTQSDSTAVRGRIAKSEATKHARRHTMRSQTLRVAHLQSVPHQQYRSANNATLLQSQTPNVLRVRTRAGGSTVSGGEVPSTPVGDASDSFIAGPLCAARPPRAEY